MKVIVSKKNEKYGPFEISQVQYYVDVGFFQLTDFCFMEGWQKWEMLSSIVSRMPQIENDIKNPPTHDPDSQSLFKTGQSEKISDVASSPLSEHRESDRISSHVNGSEQHSQTQLKRDAQGLAAQKFSNMASFGFFNYQSKNPTNALIYLARNGEIIERCPKQEIADKLSSGRLLPDDWFFDELSQEWKHLRQSSW